MFNFFLLPPLLARVPAVAASKDGGVLVDAQCRTAVQPPSEDGGGGVDVGSGAPLRPIYAAGDVAAFPLALEGFAPVRHEHIQNAR